MVKIDPYHAAHPGMHVEGSGQPPRQFGIIQRQPAVEAGISQGLTLEIDPHPGGEAGHLDRRGLEHIPTV